jgi:uncharacterized protein YciI
MLFLVVDRVRPGVGPEELERVIPPHIEWLKEMMAGGVVVQAGKWGDLGGAYVVRAEGLREAEALVEGDPLLASGLVTWDVAEFWPMAEMG